MVTLEIQIQNQVNLKCPDQCNQCIILNICVNCKNVDSLSDSSCISNTVMELDDQSSIIAIFIIILAAVFISVSACSFTLNCQYKKLLQESSRSNLRNQQAYYRKMQFQCYQTEIK
ncbi:unnamed protein product [Paramecium sonneborni]|uniref:Transmembrane protein n=1 Tax=Paramecium sonneborni TaxID=65129 RepID=A0A8S1PGY6_9CILI|nr:unnamed protein product [Paramecium sonneborni]